MAQEKRAAKEKRRDEARQRELEQRRHEDEKIQREMQLNGNGNHQTRLFHTLSRLLPAWIPGFAVSLLQCVQVIWHRGTSLMLFAGSIIFRAWLS